MEIYNSDKKVDIGLGLLTNPSKKKKKKYFDIKKVDEENISNENISEEQTDEVLLINGLKDYMKKKSIGIKEFDELMQGLIHLQLKLIKYKTFLEKIDNL